MAAILEKIGWSDEVEVLAQIHFSILSYMLKKPLTDAGCWEDCLPFKYQAAAKYSIIREQSEADIEALISQVKLL